jgi:DNA-binding CsgD family transcriptional regulator
MHVPVASEPRRNVSRDQLPSPSSGELFRTLVKKLFTTGALKIQTEDSEAEEIVLDTEFDGDRYLLIRLPRSKQSEVNLSPREQEIVRMVAQGHPNKIIADVLNISSWTVCTHLRRIFAKLGVGSRAAMVARLLQQPGVRARAKLSTSPSGARIQIPNGVTNLPLAQDSKTKPRIAPHDPLPRRAG